MREWIGYHAYGPLTACSMHCSQIPHPADRSPRYHCQSALTELGRIYKSIAYVALTTDLDIGDLSRWQVQVSMGYIRLIQARSSPALIILAYYAAAITAIRKAWYTQNWAEYTLRGINQELPPPMRHWIRWPLQQVHDHLSELGVRSPDFTSMQYSPYAG